MKNSNPIRRFIVLGRGGNESERRELCRQTHEHLVSGEGEVSALAGERPELICALNSVLAEEKIQDVCKGRSDLSGHITEELIRFVSEGCAVYDKGDPVLEEELERLQEFKGQGVHKLGKELWISTSHSLKQSMKFERKRIGCLPWKSSKATLSRPGRLI